MAAGVAEAVGAVKDSQAMGPARGARKARTGPAHGAETQRFFLAKAGGGNSVPDLGKEFATEPEAIVESLKTGFCYFTVSEWRGIADFSGKKPQLRKEAVSRVPKAG